MRVRFQPSCERLESRDVPAADFRTAPIFPGGDAAVLDHVRAVAVVGTSLGRRTDVFLKIGDSNTEFAALGENGYLRPLGAADYDPVASGLSTFGSSLLETLNTFRHPIDGLGNSFTRLDRTAGPGYQVPSVSPWLDLEITATNPGVALVMLGTNDATVGTTPQAFRANMEALLGQVERAGVVPILSTIPESLYNGPATTDLARSLNQVIADIAADNHVPLWNLFRQESSLPNQGLDPYGLHLSLSPAGGGNFYPNDLRYGQNVHNLGALQVLDWFRREVVGGAIPPVLPLPNWTSLTGHSVYAVGRDAGQGPSVSIYDAVTHAELDRFDAFEPSFIGGVRVATGDVNGDGIADIVCGAGPTGGPVVAAFSGMDGSRLATFLAFEGSFRGGVSSVAVQDLDGDGKAEIAVGAGNGGGPVIAVFSGGNFAERQRFLAYEADFRGGVNVALGSFAGIGSAIAAGAGIGGGPHVKVFPVGSTSPVWSFFAEGPLFAGGIVVAAGDWNGDGTDELATGRVTGGSPVTIWDPIANAVLRTIAPRRANALAGVRLAAIRVGSSDELLVGNGAGATVELQMYGGLNANPSLLPPDDPLRAYGIFVG